MYSEFVKIEFLTFIRQEREFENLEILKEQIYDDKERAKNFFKMN